MVTGILPSAVKTIIMKLLAFSRHNIDLEIDRENMKPERPTKAPENAGKDPSTMNMKKWYQEPTRKSDDIPSFRLQVARAIQGLPLERTEHPIRPREPIEDDEEMLAMRQGDMPPSFPERVSNPRIREDRAVQKFQSNSDKMHRAISEDAFTQAWFDYCRNVFPQSVRKTGTNVDIYSVSTLSVKHPLRQNGFLQSEE